MASSLCVVPPIGNGVCDVCHGAPFSGWARCWSCRETTDSVTYPLELVVPISLCERLGQLHYTLRKYKDHDDPQTRHELSVRLAALLARFLHGHRSCIVAKAGGDWDYITTVPSTHARSGGRPLEGVINLYPPLAKTYQRVLTNGPVPVKRLEPDDQNFVAMQKISGDSILLVDDTLTSGTSLQAAASALRLAGAEVRAGLVIGRYIKPTFSEETQALWDSVKGVTFDFDSCCVH